MGKSPNSCFKIISCGAEDTGVDDEILPPESKQSSDKRRWSFRKRSARHQVPSSTLTSATQFVGFHKENPEATADKFYPVKDSSVLETSPVTEQANLTAPLPSGDISSDKTSFVKETNETTPLSFAVANLESLPVTRQVNETAPFFRPVVNSEVEATPDTGEISLAVDANLQEKVAVVIQAAARRFLAQRELHKLKNVIKLQAAIRGHLVRKQAIGTLRCVQAITKMQVLVRSRRAHQCQLLENCIEQEKNNEDFQSNLVMRNSDIKSNRTNITVQKLLSNGFARQLLQNASKTKPINISCDPLRHDSAWQWLERWTAVTSSKVGQEQEVSFPHDSQREKENSNPAHEELDVNSVIEEAPVLSDTKLSPGKSAAAEGEEDSKTDSFGNFENQALSVVSDQCFVVSAEDNKERFHGEEAIGTKEESFAQNVEGKETSDAVSQSAHGNFIYSDSVTENFNHNITTAASDPMETEGKKIDLGPRKNRNPAFAAAQAKFEELSSAPKASRSINVSRGAAVESKTNHSQVVVTKNMDISSMVNSTAQNPIIQVAGSECGTEISISSTLDSPDRSETDGGEIVLEIGTSGEGNHNATSIASEAFNLENMNAEAKGVPITSDEKRLREDDENMVNSIGGIDSVKVNQQPVESIKPVEQENLKTEAYRLSPEGSPRSHITAPELHDTPSSQLSIQSNRSRSQNSIPTRKLKIESGNKNSPSNVRSDSDERSSTEHLLKDAKNANRRSSFGMAKPDHADNEPRRSSINSLPSYMQATESARAKAHGSVSVKSSLDVHGKDNQMKKRHSLPIGDEKQGSSPRVQRSSSQTQQSSKRNTNHSPHGSAERRWQR